jgi:hypothetical protein
MRKEREKATQNGSRRDSPAKKDEEVKAELEGRRQTRHKGHARGQV